MAETPALRFIETISPNDQMLVEDRRQQYFRWGLSAISYLDGVRALSGAPREPRTILDVPCGYGRVLRMFKARYPDAELTACDADPDAVAFCGSTFGVRTIVSPGPPEQLDLERRYDLIWVGSLFSHLDRPTWRSFLRVFTRHLEPGGLLAITTNGRTIARESRRGRTAWPGALPDTEALYETFARDGFAYQSFPASRDYGISLSLPSVLCMEVEQVPGLAVRAATEAGWNDRQDIVVAQREDDPVSVAV